MTINHFKRCNLVKTILFIILTGLLLYLIIVTYGESRNYWSEDANQPSEKRSDDENDTVDVVVLFTKTEGNSLIQMKFARFINSLFKTTTVCISLHIVGDSPSHEIAREIINKERVKIPAEKMRKQKVIHHDFNELISGLSELVSNMQQHFSYKPGAYYSDALFFMSLALHRIFSKNRVIMLDVDVEILTDIRELNEQFKQFKKPALIGIAYEQQPVYRHVFQLYRSSHPETSIGNPPVENGFPGFNSGVLLLNLDKMRQSKDYNDLLDAKVIDLLANKYQFKGHLGDQDFFTLIGLEHSELFHVLPCWWNRQLCQWWRNNGYQDVFDLFYKCDDGPVRLYHGNCNTLIPVRND